MVFIIIAIITVVMLLPLMYELPNYVYNRKYAVLKALRWNTVAYTIMFVALVGVLFADGLVMIELSSTLNFFSVRMWLGILMSLVSVIYFVRMIPVYYDDTFDVRSPARVAGVLIRELCAIAFFSGALFCVSVYTWSFILDAVIFAGLTLLRVRRFLKVRRKK